MQSAECDYRLKIILVGDAGVGKSSIMSKYADERFDFEYSSTIGVDVRVKQVVYKNKKVNLQLWDTAGQERFFSIVSTYFLRLDAVVIVFSLLERQSLKNVEKWIDAIKQKNPRNKELTYVVVGNKCDLSSYRIEIQKEEIDELIEKLKTEGYDIKYVEASAKQNINLSSIFDYIVDKQLSDERKNKKLTFKIDDDQTLIAICDNKKTQKCPSCIII